MTRAWEHLGGEEMTELNGVTLRGAAVGETEEVFQRI